MAVEASLSKEDYFAVFILAFSSFIGVQES